MVKKTKERAMRSLEDSFEIQSGIVSNHELIEAFHRVFYPALKPEGDRFHEILYRVGGSCDPISFKLSTYSAPSRGEIRQLNLPDLSKLALIEAQKYRVTYNHEVDGNYLMVDNIGNAGTYVIAKNNNPIFRIDIDPNSQWIASQITIKECKGDGLFRYLPDLGKPPQKATIETSVALKAKGDREKLTKRLFLNFHNEIKNQYQNKGATSLNESY